MQVLIKYTDYYLPKKQLFTKDLAILFNKTENDIFKNTGIEKRYISADNELSSDMGVNAARNLFQNNKVDISEIDFLIFCSEGFDYIAPATSCIMQHRLGLKTTIGCIDLPYGCSGYVYGLGIANSLLVSGMAKNILFITADIPTKVISDDDLELRSIFSDIATASVLTLKESKLQNQFVFGTDGNGALDLYVEKSAFRKPINKEFKLPKNLVSGKMMMNGSGIFMFAMKRVPQLVNDTLVKNNLNIDEIDLFIFHQASYFMLEVLRKKIKIPKEKFFVNIQDFGNSVSSSIPMAICDAKEKGILKRGMKVFLAGFGIGNSWAATVIEY